MGEIINILGFSGSLRKESYNRSALRAAVKLAPEGAQLDTFEACFTTSTSRASGGWFRS
jgi:NAD(P)H-dependent FMN reductase